MTDHIPLENYMLCALHMFCAMFKRIAGAIDFIANQVNIVDTLNKWFTDNSISITLSNESGRKTKLQLIGRDLERMMGFQDDFWKLFSLDQGQMEKFKIPQLKILTKVYQFCLTSNC